MLCGNGPVKSCATYEGAGTVAGRATAHAEAVDGHRRALLLARRDGNRYIEAEVLIGLAAAHAAAGRPDLAADPAAEALSIARAAGFHRLESLALSLPATPPRPIPRPR